MVKDGLYYGAGLSAAGLLVAVIFGGWWAVPFFATAAFCVYFFRDPERAIPDGPVAVSPADGKVVHVRSLGGGQHRVSIFLNIFNVHINRVPVSGKVTAVEYQPGKFKMAHLEDASAENEQNTVTIDGPTGPVTVRQIAGLIARRIVCDKQTGDTVHKGERFGLIKFGSRVDIFFGPEWELGVKPGDKVKGGSSVVATLRGIPRPN
jgi:phosphatidylserine decarboxylase